MKMKDVGHLLNKLIRSRKTFGTQYSEIPLVENDNMICKYADGVLMVELFKCTDLDFHQLDSAREVVMRMVDCTGIILPQGIVTVQWYTRDLHISSIKYIERVGYKCANVRVYNMCKNVFSLNGRFARMEVSRPDGKIGTCGIMELYDNLDFEGVYAGEYKIRSGNVYFKDDTVLCIEDWNKRNYPSDDHYMVFVDEFYMNTACKIFGYEHAINMGMLKFEGDFERWVNKHEQ